FARVRYTHRFGILASAGTSALAGLAVARLLDAGRRRRAWRLAAPAAIATAIMAQAAAGWPALAALPVPTGSAVPAVYRCLAEPVGTLGVETLPATLEAGGETLVTVVLANAGPIAWPATARSSRDRFALELTWDGADAEWIALPADVRPGETRRFSVWIHHP